MEIGKTERVVLAHTKEIEEVKQKYPDLAKAIQTFITKFQHILDELGSEIQIMDAKHEQELAKVLVINNIHKLTDQIFL